jgi:hypothetical protein
MNIMKLNETQVKLLRTLYGWRGSESGKVHEGNERVLILENTARRIVKFAQALEAVGLVDIKEDATPNGKALYVHPVCFLELTDDQVASDEDAKSDIAAETKVKAAPEAAAEVSAEEAA